MLMLHACFLCYDGYILLLFTMSQAQVKFCLRDKLYHDSVSKNLVAVGVIVTVPGSLQFENADGFQQ